MDDPGPRKVHSSPIPRIGGVALAISTLALVLPVFFFSNPIGRSFQGSQIQLIALLSGAVFIFLIGLIDDVYRVSGPVKLLCIVVAALAVCAAGATIRQFSLGNVFAIRTGWAAWPVTVLWIVVITVCIGVIDGLDGLAAGVAAMVCGVLAIMACWTGQPAMMVLMLALLGSITGFLFFNFYPAKIFMGDCGSMFLGFLIGAGSVICNMKTSAFVGLAVPLLALSAPILDTGLVMACRPIVERRSMFSPDRSHLHHRLLDIGFHHRSAVLLLYFITAILTGIGFLIVMTENNLANGLLLGLVAFLFSLLAYLQGGRLGKILSGIKRNWAMARQVTAEKHIFEHAQLQMRQVGSLDQWWATVCETAGKMNFQGIELWKRRNGDCTAVRSLNLRPALTGSEQTVQVYLPLGGNGQPEWEMRVFMKADANLEQCGRQTALLGRLIDEFVPHTEEQAARVADRPFRASVRSTEPAFPAERGGAEEIRGFEPVG
jgi:UDP-N-acetylmuramyl pentapeptide phosphotransferase/UDP-N-acetylglucosamine-1-phosphate transferase